MKTDREVRQFRLGGRVLGPSGHMGTVTWVADLPDGRRSVDVRHDDGRQVSFLSGDPDWQVVQEHTVAPPLGKSPPSSWRPQRSAAFAPVDFCAGSTFDLSSVLDAVLEKARRRYEAAAAEKCPIRIEGECRTPCDCRECFRHFYDPDSRSGHEACSSGPTCPRFRDLHTVVHTAAAAKHTALLLDQAEEDGVADPRMLFTQPQGVIASFGCGGGADLLGCLTWATRTYERHAASSITLRGCDVVPDWHEQASEALALAVGERSPWTRGVHFQFSPVGDDASDNDLEMFQDVDIVSLSWVLSILGQEGRLESFWRRLISRLKRGSVIVVTDRWEPDGFNRVLIRMLDEGSELESPRGVVDYDQRLMDYRFTDEVRSHGPRGKFRASGVVMRVK